MASDLGYGCVLLTVNAYASMSMYTILYLPANMQALPYYPRFESQGALRYSGEIDDAVQSLRRNLDGVNVSDVMESFGVMSSYAGVSHSGISLQLNRSHTSSRNPQYHTLNNPTQTIAKFVSPRHGTSRISHESQRKIHYSIVC